MCEMGKNGDFETDLSADLVENDAVEDISISENLDISEIDEDVETISANDLSSDAEIVDTGIDLSEVETDDFREFLIAEAGNSGEVLDIPEDIDVETISANDLSSDAEIVDTGIDLSEVETDDFREFLIAEAEKTGEFDKEFSAIENQYNDMSINEDLNPRDEKSVTQNDVEWYIDNLDKNDLMRLRDGIESGDIRVEEDNCGENGAEPIRVRTR